MVTIQRYEKTKRFLTTDDTRMNTDKGKTVDLLFEDLTYKVIGAAIEVHKVLAVFNHR